jgi:predicted ATPase/DNA-binding CsgD family transcriptional regulator
MHHRKPDVVSTARIHRTRSTPQHNLPAARSSFVGRELEAFEVSQALATTRLLTLTGAGGSGKTRFALEVARDLIEAYPDGVWLVELAPLSEEALVPKAVAEVLGVPVRPREPIADTLVEVLGERQLLLVVDNCEHLIEAVAGFADRLLDSCPGVRILATSREALGVEGEARWLVPPLSVPERGRTPTREELEGYESVRLFVERARGRDSSLSLNSKNAIAVAEICQRLEGIPLAVELAAARVGTLSLVQISERLTDSLKLLTGGARTAANRHRTLQGSLDWSHELLSEDEKELFGRLSVFAGGWTLEASEAVGAGGSVEEEDVLDLLSGLVEKSLVVTRVSDEGVVRHRMLEPIRQYALEKLEESGEIEVVRRAHAAYFLAMAERAEPELMGEQAVTWLAELGREVGNLRAALSWAFDADREPGDERVETGLRLANALARFWDTQGPDEGRRWLEQGLACDVEVPSPVRAKALGEAGSVAVYEGDPRSIPMLTEARDLYTEIGDQPGMLATVHNLGHALAHHADPETAAVVKAEVETLLADSGDRGVAAHLAHFLGLVAVAEKDLDEMRLRLKEALAIYRELEDTRNVALCLPALGIFTLVFGDFEEAEKLFEEGLAWERRLKYKTLVYFHLMGLAAVATHRDQLRRAAQLYGASEALRKATGLSPKPFGRITYEYEGYLATVRAGLDEPDFDAAWSEGRAMSLERTIEYALSAETPSATAPSSATTQPSPPSAPEHPAGLTSREMEVLGLVAAGMTSAQIAEELFLSTRTVEAHLTSIYHKLGVSSRAGATRFALEHALT